MKKYLTIILIIIAIPIYVYDIYHIVGARMGNGAGEENAGGVSSPSDDLFALVMQGTGQVSFVEKGKSPFEIYKTIPKPVRKAPARRPKPKPKPVKVEKPLPRVTINGIMWSESNPVAILVLPDGSSVVANAGKELSGGLLVKKVEQTRVQLVHEGREFWVAK